MVAQRDSTKSRKRLCVHVCKRKADRQTDVYTSAACLSRMQHDAKNCMFEEFHGKHACLYAQGIN